MACCMNLSVTVGTPRFLTPPSGFGISTLRTGWGLYFLVLNCSLMISPFFSRCSLSSVYFIPSTPSAPLFRTTCRYALLRLSLDSICSIRLLVSMRSFLSASLDLTTLPRLVTADVVISATRDILKLIDCSPLRSISITETSSLLWARLTSHSSLLLG